MDLSTWSIAPFGVALLVILRGCFARSGTARPSRVLWLVHLRHAARYGAAGAIAAVVHLVAINTAAPGRLAARLEAVAVLLSAAGIAHTWLIARRGAYRTGEHRGCVVDAGTASDAHGAVAYDTWLVLDAHHARLHRPVSLAAPAVRAPAAARAVWRSMLVRGNLDIGGTVAVWNDDRWEVAGPVRPGGMAALSDTERW